MRGSAKRSHRQKAQSLKAAPLTGSLHPPSVTSIGGGSFAERFVVMPLGVPWPRIWANGAAVVFPALDLGRGRAVRVRARTGFTF